LSNKFSDTLRFPNAEGGNREHWDELAEVHYDSYDYRKLLEGGQLLDSVQLEEVGEVTGRSLLHLQCHIGTDTLSWARLGAEVTGVDISPVSLRMAANLAARTGLEGRFIEASLFDLPDKLDDSFDIVYTSIGVLCWLSDLNAWARIIHRYLKPGGFFYIMESHPFLNIFDDESPGLVVRYPYFHGDDPHNWPGNYPDYSDEGYIVKSPSWEWNWSLGDIVNSLIDAGLKLEFVHEHDFIHWKALPIMVKSENGYWRMPESMDVLPLVFSIRAFREL
jgi:SAM-dependent methyltransferase